MDFSINDIWVESTILLLLSLVGFLGGSYESALLASSRSNLRELIDNKKRLARNFLDMAAKGDISVRLRSALLHTLGSGSFLIFGGLVTFPRFMPEDMITAESLLIAVSLLLFQLLIRASSAMTGDYFAEKLVVFAALPVALISFPLIPIAWTLIKCEKIILRAAGVTEEDSEDEREAEVIAAVSDGELDGVVEEGQREMIEGIFELKDADAADIFVPRTEMTTLDADLTLTEAVALALDKGYSRVPVHKGTRDHIVGIFYVRDALLYWNKPENERPKLSEILHEPLFVPETKKISELLTEMRLGKSHMAVVLDEYGGTAGLVTIEDVLEEIVGEIHDEFDQRDNNSEAEIQLVGDSALITEGHAHVSDINKALDIDIIPEDDDYETVAGFVLDNFGHIPEAGESFIYDNKLKVKVIMSDGRRVRKVKMRVVEDSE